MKTSHRLTPDVTRQMGSQVPSPLETSADLSVSSPLVSSVLHVHVALCLSRLSSAKCACKGDRYRV